MITTTLPLTLFLAKVLGGYMIAAGVSGLTDRERWTRLIEELKTGTAIAYITGVMVFAMGAVMIRIHNVWTDPLAIIISLFAWGALVEGVLFIAIPRLFLKATVSLVRPASYTPFAFVALVAGLALCGAGFVGRAG